ncbi:hypothetical protein D0Z00_000575 [Geotrichum galactomycetum]|uniref:Uncharacterized protein n=1 Tax=Geotrichum galactomycetum TaxID=27317 RepID=A0ACB6V9B9_9ASCO|nr:hypothetical protein D0Z00_000575 [Geotrichum candidum]
MPTTTINNPEVLWAQRSNKDVPEKNIIYLTIAVENTISPKLELTADELHYHSKNKEGKEFDLKLPFYEKIDPENSKIAHNDRHTYAVIRKATPAEEYWPRLTKEKVKYFFIKTDFDKWADEDEQEEAPEPSNDAFDLGGMGGMPGMPGMGGMGGMGGPGGFDLSSLGGLGGLGGGDSASELLESLKNDAALSGKSLDDFAKQYSAGADKEEEEDEDDAEEVNTVKNDALS